VRLTSGIAITHFLAHRASKLLFPALTVQAIMGGSNTTVMCRHRHEIRPPVAERNENIVVKLRSARMAKRKKFAPDPSQGYRGLPT
jgi:hypothetical protein